MPEAKTNISEWLVATSANTFSLSVLAFQTTFCAACFPFFSSSPLPPPFLKPSPSWDLKSPLFPRGTQPSGSGVRRGFFEGVATRGKEKEFPEKRRAKIAQFRSYLVFHLENRAATLTCVQTSNNPNEGKDAWFSAVGAKQCSCP